jgi:hypothetical protein
MSICKPCADVAHWSCAWPASCSCAHKSPGPRGEFDEWSYVPISLVFEDGTYGWVWRVTHPEGDEMLIDRQGASCTLSFGERGAKLSYEEVDKSVADSVS